MTRQKSTIIGVGFLLLSILILGCGKPYVTRKAGGTEFTPNPHIAVLPFDNLTDHDQVSAKVTEYFQTLLVNQRGLTVVEAGTVFETLRRHRIRSAILLSEAQIDTLANELGAQYLLCGSVLEYVEDDNTYLGKVPQVSLDARMIDCRSKKTVWTGVSNDRGDRKEIVFGLGVTRSADELARHVIEGLVDDIQGLFKE